MRLLERQERIAHALGENRRIGIGLGGLALGHRRFDRLRRFVAAIELVGIVGRENREDEQDQRQSEPVVFEGPHIGEGDDREYEPDQCAESRDADERGGEYEPLLHPGCLSLVPAITSDRPTLWRLT